jgi:hypothetical protein
MESIPRDVREFLDNYPRDGDDPTRSENLQFYSNELRCRPDRCLIEEIHDRLLCSTNWTFSPAHVALTDGLVITPN